MMKQDIVQIVFETQNNAQYLVFLIDLKRNI